MTLIGNELYTAPPVPLQIENELCTAPPVPLKSEKQFIDAMNMYIQIHRIPAMVRNILFRSISNRLYTTREFHYRHNKYAARSLDETVMNYMLAKMLQPYYPKNVVSGYKVFAEDDMSPYWVRLFRQFTIHGSDFLVPIKKVAGSFAYIRIHHKYAELEGSYAQPSVSTSVTMTFFGCRHQLLAERFEDKYIKIIRDAERFENDGLVCVYTHTGDSYQSSDYIPYRKISSVILDETLLRDLVKEIQQFVQPSTRAFYREIQEPYHFNMLFYGVPGTGKTSLITALATELRRVIHRISPKLFRQSEEAARSFLVEVSGIQNAIVVIDEADLIIKNRKEKMSEEEEATLHTILNYLDDVGDGNIVILCTNHPDRLDPAIQRSGRINLKIPFSDWKYPLLEKALTQHHVTIEELEEKAGAPIVQYNQDGTPSQEATYNPATIMELIRKIRLERFINAKKSKSKN